MTQERRTFGAAVKAKAALATAQAAFNQHRGRGRGGFEPWGSRGRESELWERPARPALSKIQRWDAWVPADHPPVQAMVQVGLGKSCKVEMVVTAAVSEG